MTRFRLSPQAVTDLEQIHAYVATDHPQAARDLVGRFFDRFEQLAQHPELGMLREDLRPALRLWSEGRYAILYFARADVVEIAHIVHGARDIESLLRSRRE